MFLDLETYSCASSCSNNQKGYSLETADTTFTEPVFRFCRSTSYFIDPDSQEEVELGTFDFPFKSLIWPTREIFKLMNAVDQNITFFLK